MGVRKKYVCVNCGHTVDALYKKLANSVKTVQCVNCNLIADKYIEFDPVFELIDAVLLSQLSFRHMLFNGDFKLHWKLSVILLLLESYALWNKLSTSREFASEAGFYYCCLQNLFDYYLTAMSLFLITLVWHGIGRIRRRYGGLLKLKVILLKMMAIANFSKIFLIPVMIWRKNITDIGADLHYDLVIGHHLIALVLAYAVASGCNKWQSTAIVLPTFLLKEVCLRYLSPQLSETFLG